MENKLEEFRLSVSKTKCFLQCKKQYEYSYILKLPKKERDYHIFGKFCHKVLEDFHNIYINGSAEPPNKIMTTCFKDAKKEYQGKMTPEMIKDCFAILDTYLKKITKKEPPESSSNVIACEKPFNFLINDRVVLNGMIDRIQLDPDGVVHVCDYKTVKNKKYLKDDFFQLLTYAYVIASEDPSITKVRASYILLRYDFEYMTQEFGIDEINSIKEKYINYANQILEEKEFKPTPSKLCEFCDFLDVCKEGTAFVSPITTYGEVKW